MSRHPAETCSHDPAEQTPPLPKVVIAFAVLYIVWGSTYLAIRVVIETLPPLLMASARFLIAGLILTVVGRARTSERLNCRYVAATAIVGTLLLSANGLVCWAELTVPSGMAALIVATMPLWMVILEWLFFGGSRPKAGVLLGVGIGLAGVYLLLDPSGFDGPVPCAGIVALLLGCVFWASGSLYARQAPLPRSSLLATGMEMLAGAVVLGLAGLALGEGSEIHWSSISLRSVIAWVYLVVFGSLLGFTAYLWLLKVSTPTRVSTYAYVNPTVAVLLGTVVGKETLSLEMIIGGAVILASVGLILHQSRRPRDEAPTSSEGSP